MAVIIAVAVMTTAMPVRAASFGNSAPGANVSAGLSANFKRGSRFNLTEAGTMQSLCAYLDFAGGGSEPQDVRLALYRDANGVPGAKVVDSDKQTFTINATAGWKCFDTALYPIAAGAYWIVIHSGGNGALVRDHFAPGTANWYGNADVFSDGASNTFGAGNAGTGTLSVYAQYYSASENLLHTFGKTTIGANPSKGLAVDFKRASSFTVTEPGQLTAFSVYLDGLGGGSGSEFISVGVYGDANGAPGHKVTQSQTSYVQSGTPGRWMTLPAVPALLQPGRYWIAILSTGAGGVARDYADPTGGWAGNAEPSHELPYSFGATSVGTGAISVFGLYKPGTTTLLKLGKTTVGGTPSKGLSANYVRGGGVSLGAESGVATALYAYLDGNGGAAGSQQVMMQLYSAYAAEHSIYKIGESAIVTIPAGTPPGWVRFPINAAYINEEQSYLVMIDSGNNAGVVRDYGDNVPPYPAWIGTSDGGFPGYGDFNYYPSGYPNPPPAPSYSTTELSVYLEYFVPR